MKLTLLLINCLLPFMLFCQETLEGKWKFACGASTTDLFKQSSCINLRALSPRFKSNNEEWTAEMEEHPEKYKPACFMMEVLYTPPLKILCVGINLQYQLLKYKRFSLEVYGGLKYIPIAPPDFIKNPNLAPVVNKTGWYCNIALLCQLDLGMLAPFVDAGYDGILTIGTNLNLHAIYKNPKRRYKLRTA